MHCAVAASIGGGLTTADDTDGLLSTDMDTDIGTDAESHISLDGRRQDLQDQVAGGDALDPPGLTSDRTAMGAQENPTPQPRSDASTQDAGVLVPVDTTSTPSEDAGDTGGADEVDDSIVSL